MLKENGKGFGMVVKEEAIKLARDFKKQAKKKYGMQKFDKLSKTITIPFRK